MKKRKLLLCLLTLALAVPAAADNEWSGEGYSLAYETSEEGVIITGLGGSYENYGGGIEIPAQISNQDVVAIDDKAFIGDDITFVVIKASVSIGKKAFGACTNLECVNCEESGAITSLDETSFTGCTALETLDLSGATEIPVLNGLTALQTVDVSGATNIPESAFAGLQNLTTVKLSESSVTIDASAFKGCSAITSMTLTGVTSIGKEAFSGTGLTGELGLSNVTKIDESAFYNTNITTVELGEGEDVEIIDGAFGLCLSLKTVNGKPSKVGESAFANCIALTTVDLSSATNIGANAFANCSALTKVTLKENVTLGASAFYSTGLTSVSVNTATISESAFANCTSLTELTLGSSVTTIEKNAFAGCSQLATIDIPAIEGTSETAIECGENVFNGVPTTCEVLVSSAAIATLYNNADGWKDLVIVRTGNLTITIGAVGEGYATYYSDSEYVLPEGSNVEAAIVTDVTDNGATLEWRYGNDYYTYTNDSGVEVTSKQEPTVPAGTAILVRYILGENETWSEIGGEYGKSIECAIVTPSATKPTKNMLHGSENGVDADQMKSITVSDSGEGDYYYYSLAYDSSTGNVGWYRYTSNGAAFKLSANKAWLAVPQSNVSTKALGFAFEGTGNTTGIEAVESGASETTDSDVIYNLQGVRVNDMSQKGVYIVNGKKVVKR